MVITASVRNGVVVLPEGIHIPDGAIVYVTVPGEVEGAPKSGERVKLPIFPYDGPPDIDLTNAQIGEILDREDASR